MGTIALIATAVVLALWFKRTGERHDRAFADQQVRLEIIRPASFQRQNVEAVEVAPYGGTGQPGLRASRPSPTLSRRLLRLVFGAMRGSGKAPSTRRENSSKADRQRRRLETGSLDGRPGEVL